MMLTDNYLFIILLTLLNYFSYLIYLKVNKEFESCQLHHKFCFGVLNSN